MEILLEGKVETREREREEDVMRKKWRFVVKTYWIQGVQLKNVKLQRQKMIFYIDHLIYLSIIKIR